MTARKTLTLWLALCSAVMAPSSQAVLDEPGRSPPPRARGELRIATWNLEWLIAPEAFRTLARDCVPRGASPGPRQRFIPCNVADQLERSSTDFRTLERYAERLDADVIALQEVDGPAAARRVFRNHSFCFTARQGVQNTGFAIRRGIAHRCGEDLTSLSLDERVRRGAVLILYPGESREIHLLSVHLKSGCPRRSLDDPRDDCRTLARQVTPLEAWVDEQAAAGRRFAVLGDFNHDLLAASGRVFWGDLNDGEPTGAALVNVAAGQPFVNCSSAENYTSYIDHVLLGASLATQRGENSFIRLTYDTRDALRRKLPDHCPVGVDLRLR